MCQTDFQINGKSSGSFDRRCLDLNASYDEFLSRINTVAAAKKKLRIDVIQAARSTIRYYWLAGNKVHALPKNLGNPDFLVHLVINTSDNWVQCVIDHKAKEMIVQVRLFAHCAPDGILKPHIVFFVLKENVW